MVQPPGTVQVKGAVPDGVKVMVEPTHGVPGSVKTPGMAGTLIGATDLHALYALQPQLLHALTRTQPEPLPTVTEMELVLLEPDHPAGNVH